MIEIKIKNDVIGIIKKIKQLKLIQIVYINTLIFL